MEDKVLPNSQIESLLTYLNQQVVGQSTLIENMLITMLAGGHALLEGPPGIAKTRAVSMMAKGIHGNFQRIQFTPDLLPADLTGSDIFLPETSEFQFQSGPLFNHLILADEINRAPAKVQSALLEAMAEGQISVGKQSYALPEFFMVLATQNPFEHEGTYPLPEAQLDRFMMHIKVDYPSIDAERSVLRMARDEIIKANTKPSFSLSIDDILATKKQVAQIHVSEALEDYILHLIQATRTIGEYVPAMSEYLRAGGSPRATLALERCAQAHAYLMGRDFVAPDNVHFVFHNILRHRLLLSYQADANSVSSDHILDAILDSVPLP